MGYPVDTGRKLNVLCTFNLRPVSNGARLFIESSSIGRGRGTFYKNS